MVASAFGGLLYVVVPKGAAPARVRVTIKGAVKAPLFVKGRTAAKAWHGSIRGAPGPWAEIGTDKLVLTVPSTVVRLLDDPTAVLTHWDQVLDACADLATIPRKRARPERLVTDRQISAGYMHSGYPIMTGLDVTEAVVSATRMKAQGGWGFYHELGHNHQSSLWTFSGTTEVTVNLFTVYVYHTIHGNKQPRTSIYGAGRKQKLDVYFKGGAKFSTWKADPFLALIMYLQLQEAFGWDAYKKVFAEYRGLSAAERPSNDEQKRDQWMVHFSKAVARNLGPFFQKWGVPTTAGARASISHLKTWMPAELSGY